MNKRKKYALIGLLIIFGFIAFCLGIGTTFGWKYLMFFFAGGGAIMIFDNAIDYYLKKIKQEQIRR